MGCWLLAAATSSSSWSYVQQIFREKDKSLGLSDDLALLVDLYIVEGGALYRYNYHR